MKMHNIKIKQLAEGYIVTIGCQQYAVLDKEELISRITEYIRDPRRHHVEYERTQRAFLAERHDDMMDAMRFSTMVVDDMEEDHPSRGPRLSTTHGLIPFIEGVDPHPDGFTARGREAFNSLIRSMYPERGR